MINSRLRQKALFSPTTSNIRKSIALFDGSEDSPACPSDMSNIKMNMSMEHRCNYTNKGKPKHWKNTCPSVTLSTANPTWPNVASRPATNLLSHVTAISNWILCKQLLNIHFLHHRKHTASALESHEIHTLCGWNAEFLNGNTGGAYSYHCVLDCDTHPDRPIYVTVAVLPWHMEFTT